MKLSSALCLALALGWARENASYSLFPLPRGRRHAFTLKELQSTPSSSSSSSPHPPNEPPSNALLNLYFASTPSQTSADQQPATVESESAEQLTEPIPILELSSAPEPTSSPEPTPAPTYVPAKPWMTEEQKEEINALTNRLVQDVWKPLFESAVQPGVPADTIKGAALVGATLAFLASKGLVVTSAAGLSAAYVAISQGVAGDVLRTMGGIAWDVTESANKLLQMATTTESMTGISKELVDKVTSAVKVTQSRATALQDLGDTTNVANVQEATEAFLESQGELARVLREAETAIGAADAAIAQAEQTLWQDQLETTSATMAPLTVDVSVPYNDAAKLAYEASDKAIPYDAFETKYLAAAIASVKSKSKTQASKQKMEQETKRKAAEEEKARIAAEQEAKRKAADEEKARIAAEQEAKRKAAEVEKARIAAEQEAKRKAADEEKARIAAEQEAQRKAAAEEKARRIAAEQETKQKAAEVEKARVAAEQEAQRKAAEEEKARIAAAEASKKKAVIDDEEDDDDDWLAAVEMAQQGIEGKIVGLADAIRDESGKASWDAAGALAQELSAFEDDEDDDVDNLDLAALGRAARAAVDKFESQRGVQDNDEEDDEDDDDDDDLDDLFDVDNLDSLGAAARKAVEAFGEDDFEDDDDDEDDDGVKGIDGMYVASSSAGKSSSTGSSSRQPVQRDWSALTVSKLKDELRFRGLKAYGKKTELVAMLEAYDRDQFGAVDNDFADDDDEDVNVLPDDSDSEDELLVLVDLDLEELGRQARAAVELGNLGGFDAEEPSDEVLMQLESEESLLLSDFLGAGKKNEKERQQKDYSRMTVLELKEELRERGLPLSGKKAELIERLQATDLS